MTRTAYQGTVSWSTSLLATASFMLVVSTAMAQAIPPPGSTQQGGMAPATTTNWASTPSAPLAPPGEPFPPPAMRPAPQAAPPGVTMPGPGPAPMEGVTPDGLPISRRGHVSIEMSTMEVRQIYGLVGEPGVDQHVAEYQTFATAVTFDARARITGGLFATARFGSGFSSLENGAVFGLKAGNLMGGVEHVFTTGRGLWLVAGLSLGAPLRQDRNGPPNYGFADGMWSIHESLGRRFPSASGPASRWSAGGSAYGWTSSRSC